MKLILRDDKGRERTVRDNLRREQIADATGDALLDDILFELDKLARPLTAQTAKPWEDEG